MTVHLKKLFEQDPLQVKQQTFEHQVQNIFEVNIFDPF